MLIRCRGYNAGVKEYLEDGQKSGRELSRDELDERIILDGNLDLTDMVYKSIPDKGQDRYLTFTLSFKEEQVDDKTLSAITQEFKSFLMKSYSPDEFNFYAEAHLPKVKTMEDRKTGEIIDRKPHIHIVIPRRNMLSGNEMNPVGNYKHNEKYFEAFQEYINQKYELASPRDNVRLTPTSYADVLSRYKGDDFRAKNKEFKSQILKQVYDEDVKSRQSFYDIVSQYGETKVRNEGKPTEYIAVKLAGDKKFTNLKESIFSDDFIVHRRISKPPLEQHVIKSRFSEWGRRSDEIKYIDKIASERLRDKYYSSDDKSKMEIMQSCINKFTNEYRGSNGIRSKRATNNERSLIEAQRGSASPSTYSVQNLPDGNVASSRQGKGNKSLLSGDARLHMVNEQTNRDSGLRRTISDGGRRGGRRVSHSPDSRLRTEQSGTPQYVGGALPGNRSRSRTLQLTPYPVIPRFKNKIPTIRDIDKRGGSLFPTGKIKSTPSVINSPKPVNADANTSSLSAWLLRRIGENTKGKTFNNLLKTIDKDFYDIRKEVLSDKRFSYEEKNQIVSVINFERLKRKHSVLNENEGYIMGSKEIKDMLRNKDKNLSGFTISAPEREDKEKAQSRFAQVIDRLRNPINYSKVADESRKAVEKHLDAGNLYTKRTRKGHVHYLDKTSDKTLFVDTGKLITMRKNGLSNDSVAVALELAQGRFGSTLNIKGSQKFKDAVVNVVAERGLDIHFTDKKMNDALALRRAELLKAKEQQSGSERGSAFTIEGAEPERTVVREETAAVDDERRDASPVGRSNVDDEPLYRSVNHLEGKIVKHGAAPYLNKDGNSDSYYVVLKGKDGQESTQWGVGLKDALKGFRRGQEVALDLKESKPVQVRVRDEKGQFSTREAVRNVWEATSLSKSGNRKASPATEKQETNYREEYVKWQNTQPVTVSMQLEKGVKDAHPGVTGVELYKLLVEKVKEVMPVETPKATNKRSSRNSDVDGPEMA